MEAYGPLMSFLDSQLYKLRRKLPHPLQNDIYLNVEDAGTNIPYADKNINMTFSLWCSVFVCWNSV